MSGANKASPNSLCDTEEKFQETDVLFFQYALM